MGDGDDDLAGGQHLLTKARRLGPEDQAGALGQYGPFKGDGAVDVVDADEGQPLARAVVDEFAYLGAVINGQVAVG